ncbi:MAG TPA: hypothetical protein VM681_09840 [Candidatus Thermoplasmatota archaeon]|nr:hypothetical protein [Candidatus Thermoplasmatota archaeon]
MVRTCGTCGAGNPDVNDACAACGASLPPPATPQGQGRPPSAAPSYGGYAAPPPPPSPYPSPQSYSPPPSYPPPAPYGYAPTGGVLVTRPSEGSIAGAIFLITGLGWLLLPLLLLGGAMALSFVPFFGEIFAALFIAMSFVFAIPAVIWLIAAWGLLTDKDWAPVYGMLVAGLGVVLSLATIATGWSAAFLVVYLAALYCLTRPNVKAWYESRRMPTWPHPYAYAPQAPPPPGP